MQDNKESVIIFKIQTKAKDALISKASSLGMTTSDYVRMTLELGEIKLSELDAQSKMSPIEVKATAKKILGK